METETINVNDEYYARATKYIAIAGLVLFPGFAVNNFIQGRILIGFITIAVIFVLAFNALLVYRVGYNAIRAFFLQIPPILFFIAMVFVYQGVIGALWCTPALLSFYFMLPERYAWVASILLLVLATALSYVVLEPGLAFRVFATLAISIIFTTIFVRIILKQQIKLQYQAIIDPLTGLKNRTLLAESIEQAKKFSERNNIPMTVLIMDLDHFKYINDDFGHDEGDRVLECAAKVIKDRVRGSDMAFRAGGEEFLCLLYDCSSDDGTGLAEQMRAEIKEGCSLQDRHVTVSIGVAGLLPEETTTSWLKRADNNLYQAKSMGRDKVVCA